MIKGNYGIVFYTNNFVVDGFAATTRGPFIFIRPEYKDDKGLLEHEQTHVRQFLSDYIWLFVYRYKFSRYYRKEYEAEAYANQAKCYTDDRVPRFAKFLSEKYDLGITPEIAERCIRDKMKE